MSRPDKPEVRISDADRERAVQRLNDAVAEGRLTLPEFEERVDRVLQARTNSEVQPYLADLPAPLGEPATTAAPERGELRTTMSNLKRVGRWVVPRRLAVHSKAGSVRLDFTQALIGHPVVEIALEIYAGSTTIVLPEGASVDVEQVEAGMVASSVKVRKVPTTAFAAAGQPHLVISGKLYASSLVVRHQHKFLWWRW